MFFIISAMLARFNKSGAMEEKIRSLMRRN